MNGNAARWSWEKSGSLLLKKKNQYVKENFQFLPLKRVMHMFFNKTEPTSHLYILEFYHSSISINIQEMPVIAGKRRAERSEISSSLIEIKNNFYLWSMIIW